MSSIDFIASQAPMIPEALENLRTYWKCSRHPDNIKDIMDSARSETITPPERRRTKAGIAAIALAGGPLNEAVLTLGVGNTLSATNSVLPAIGAVAPITGTMELASGIGTAYIADKFPGAVDIIKERYISKTPEEDDNYEEATSPTKPKQLARTLGIVGLTGTGSAGATLDYELHDKVEVGGYKRNKKVSKVASAMLVGINMAYVGAILGTTKGVEKVGVSNATEAVANVTRNPLIVGGAIVAAVVGKKEYDWVKFRLKKRSERKKIEYNLVHGDTQCGAESGEVYKIQESKECVS